MNAQTSSPGPSLGGVIFIVFLVLRLTHVDEWSWWWVTAPVWIPYVLAPGAIIARYKGIR